MSDLMNKIKSLRDLSGAGFLDCKKALEKNNDDIEKSIVFLRKNGLIKAAKKSSREAKEGAVGIFSNDQNEIIIEINTETDFAAKNEVFLNFFDSIGECALNIKNIKSLKTEDLLKSEYKGRPINDHITDLISKIGENIILNRFNVIEKNDNSKIFSYIHNPYKNHIGKIAVILQANINNDNKESNQLGKNLCMHIAASKPIALNIENLDLDLINKEKEIQLSTIKSSGKPDNIIEKILEGKMKKFFSEVTLLNQSYILDTDKKVHEVIKEFSQTNSFEILDYKILMIGS